MNEKSIFSKIIDREVPADIVFENDNIIVIKDIKNDAPVHLLAITKEPFESMHELILAGEKDLLWEIMCTLANIAEELEIDQTGYRIMTNIGEDADQTIKHLHVHLLGGGKLHPNDHIKGA